MKQVIFKYPLATVEEQVIEMPKGAEILSLQVQNNLPTLWAMVDTEAPLEGRVFISVLTGGALKVPREGLSFLGTAQMNNGAFVVHVFEMPL